MINTESEYKKLNLKMWVEFLQGKARRIKE